MLSPRRAVKSRKSRISRKRHFSTFRPPSTWTTRWEPAVVVAETSNGRKIARIAPIWTKIWRKRSQRWKLSFPKFFWADLVEKLRENIAKPSSQGSVDASPPPPPRRRRTNFYFNLVATFCPCTDVASIAPTPHTRNFGSCNCTTRALGCRKLILI